MEIVVETENLTKVYEGKIVAVDNANIKIPKGTIVGLIGHNGAGKTTLISMLTGLILPTKGTGRVLGYDIIRESLQIRRHIGLLPEGFGFYDSLTARQNLEYIAELNGIKGKEAEKRIDEVLKIVGLENQKEQKVKAFSRGMKQRLGIAQALLKDPEILILDEPTVGIDPEGAIGFRMLMQRLAKEGRTVILSTHLLHELGDICNYVIIMRQGKILAQGFVSDLQKEYEAKKGYVYIIKVRNGLDELIDKLREIGKIAVKENIVTVRSREDIIEDLNKVLKSLEKVVVEEFKTVKPTLENLFIYYYYGR